MSHNEGGHTAAAAPYPAIGINSGWSLLPATFTPGERRGGEALPDGAFGLVEA